MKCQDTSICRASCNSASTCVGAWAMVHVFLIRKAGGGPVQKPAGPKHFAAATRAADASFWLSETVVAAKKTSLRGATNPVVLHDMHKHLVGRFRGVRKGVSLVPIVANTVCHELSRRVELRLCNWGLDVLKDIHPEFATNFPRHSCPIASSCKKGRMVDGMDIDAVDRVDFVVGGPLLDPVTLESEVA